MVKKIYVYVNVGGRIIEAVPDKVEQKGNWYSGKYEAAFKKQVNSEDYRDGYYRRQLNATPGELLGNTVWFNEQNYEGAKKIFLDNLDKKIAKVSRQFDNLLEERERLND